MTRKFTGDTLLVATHNKGKLEEIAALLAPLGVRAVGADGYDLPEPAELGTTFRANALTKAQAAAAATGLPALSDDSGLSVEAFDGFPGVYTADWAETPNGRDFPMAMAKVWSRLQRQKVPAPYVAHFCCTLALAWPDGHAELFEGRIRGQITWPMRGDQGHGYDPIFMPDGHDVTFAQMDRWEKNKLSHRGRAFELLMAGCFDR